ncbi:Serine/threonine-protein phosphatase 1 [Aquisphaera giovannonii]|uniref:Serine/threonine-protein phosphatase 1 n=1 Tax=Aquisphaera giovannonii TaxID=406548 RepID=A0A5B9W8X5_9BACT|nr:metallophosphoesterase family protein [Aquisphaera giovannonii]QEH36639.1 Serine/threonine-protein phosphatase 1 [Aquisphaera giovannonii]
MRTIAIGDIHGCAEALEALLRVIRPEREDCIVSLGDYVDRGPDSRGVIDRLIALGRECSLVPLLGNHDELFLHACEGKHRSAFLLMGGAETMESYGAGSPPDFNKVPPAHLRFLEACRPYHETETHLFLHASYVPTLPMAEQPALALRWEKLYDEVPAPHFSGKTAIVGHTSQKSGEILDLGHIKCIDTRCFGDGWLTAMEVHSGRLWQADRRGRIRDREFAA